MGVGVGVVVKLLMISYWIAIIYLNLMVPSL